MRFLLLISLVMVLGVSTAEGQVPALAQKVSRLRSEVDTLAQRVEEQRRTTREDLTALRAERAELQRQLRLEKVRAQTLATLEAQRLQKAKGLEGRTQEWVPPIRAAVRAAKTYVQSSLPFQVEGRLEVLRHIERDLAASHPDAGRALARLWRFIEEEEALTKEIGLSQQAVELDGTRRLVDVARVGMALLYVRTPNGDVAWAQPISQDGQTGGWRFVRIEDPIAANAVRRFFSALDNNRGYGLTTLLVPPHIPTSTRTFAPPRRVSSAAPQEHDHAH